MALPKCESPNQLPPPRFNTLHLLGPFLVCKFVLSLLVCVAIAIGPKCNEYGWAYRQVAGIAGRKLVAGNNISTMLN